MRRKRRSASLRRRSSSIRISASPSSDIGRALLSRAEGALAAQGQPSSVSSAGPRRRIATREELRELFAGSRMDDASRPAVKEGLFRMQEHDVLLSPAAEAFRAMLGRRYGRGVLAFHGTPTRDAARGILSEGFREAKDAIRMGEGTHLRPTLSGTANYASAEGVVLECEAFLPNDFCLRQPDVLVCAEPALIFPLRGYTAVETLNARPCSSVPGG
jgi:hypothetical protein